MSKQPEQLPSIRQVWPRLSLDTPCPELDRKDSRCPFHVRHRHGDRRPSFALLDEGQSFACHGCGAKGGVIAFVTEATGLTLPESARWIRDRFRDMGSLPVHRPPLPVDPLPEPIEPRFAIFPQTTAVERKRRDAMREAASASRGLPQCAFGKAESLGIMRYGSARGHDAWILSDREGRIHEARRIDGQPFPAIGAKADACCSPGGKRWPVLSDMLPDYPTAAVLLTEGAPDLLTGIALVNEAVANVIPAGMLGSASIHPAALPRFQGRRVLITADPGAKGGETAKQWAAQLRSVGCQCSAMQHPEHDLNDLYRSIGGDRLWARITELLNKL